MPTRQPGVNVKPDPARVAGFEDREYTAGEVAELFEVDILTVRRWCRSGQLNASKETVSRAGGGWRISRESMIDFARRRYMS